jgi:hypothetical protein
MKSANSSMRLGPGGSLTQSSPVMGEASERRAGSSFAAVRIGVDSLLVSGGLLPAGDGSSARLNWRRDADDAYGAPMNTRKHAIN